MKNQIMRGVKTVMMGKMTYNVLLKVTEVILKAFTLPNPNLSVNDKCNMSCCFATIVLLF